MNTLLLLLNQNSNELTRILPVSTAECLDILKQTFAWLWNGIEQLLVASGIKLGLNDTVLSTITIGFDLKGESMTVVVNKDPT